MPNYYSGTAGTDASGFTSIFSYNAPYLSVTNTSANTLYLTTDGVTVPTVDGDSNVYVVNAGDTVVIPNQAAGTWHQSQSVIAPGELVGGTPGTPAEVMPYGAALDGGVVNPGVSVNTIASAASTTFTITEIG